MNFSRGKMQKHVLFKVPIRYIMIKPNALYAAKLGKNR